MIRFNNSTDKPREPISKRLKSVTPAKAHVQKSTENTGYYYDFLRVKLSPELQQQTFEIGSRDKTIL
jgi:hypothetical protein